MSEPVCKCHSDLIYASLTTCPKCGHRSFEDLGTWGGCERRACGCEITRPAPPKAEGQK